VERGLARNTLSSYRRDLSRYLGELAAQGIERLDATSEEHVAAFLAALRRGDATHPPMRA
jgi:integrase/recombinase XerD